MVHFRPSIEERQSLTPAGAGRATNLGAFLRPSLLRNTGDSPKKKPVRTRRQKRTKAKTTPKASLKRREKPALTPVEPIQHRRE